MADININDFSDINWFPGHMAKAKREIEENLKLVDIVIEIRDARCPKASENPLLAKLINNKPHLIILNKADLADEKENNNWLNYYKDNNCMLLDSLNTNITNQLVNKVKQILKDKLDKAKARGIKKKVLRAMVVGIPNVGKSTFINNIVKKKVAKVENRPGVTKSLQWIRINEDLELLDTPGVLWPKIEDKKDALVLALLGSIKDDVVDKEQLLNFGLNYLKTNYFGLLNKRYSIDETKDNLIDEIALNKKWLTVNNAINYEYTYSNLLKDIRSNSIGRITWEKYDAS